MDMGGRGAWSWSRSDPSVVTCAKLQRQLQPRLASQPPTWLAATGDSGTEAQQAQAGGRDQVLEDRDPSVLALTHAPTEGTALYAVSKGAASLPPVGQAVSTADTWSLHPLCKAVTAAALLRHP